MATAVTPAETVIEARWVIPVAPARQVLPEHAVVVDKGRIVAILPTSEARRLYQAQQRVELPDHVLIPGLINLHTHAAMTLMRGLADDLGLMDWLNKHIWPAEMKHTSDQFVYDGSLLACAEMLRAGITCFNDMYFFPQATARAAREAGMRAAIGMIVTEFQSPYAADAQDYLSKGLALRDELRGDPLIRFCLAPHAPYTVSDASLRQVSTYASELDLPVHMHVHETIAEIDQSLQLHGVRPLQRLAGLGLVGPNLIAVHAIHLEEDEIGLLASHGCHIAHCPSSNLKLASGIAPVATLLDAGINVGLGTDGAASNNRLDILGEMRLAALLAKGSTGEPTALGAWQALEMATLSSARALGAEREIGSLAAGKLADMAAVRMDALETWPCFDPHSHLVYTSSREHVTHVWVGGRLLLADRELTALDTREIIARGTFWRDRIGRA